VNKKLPPTQVDKQMAVRHVLHRLELNYDHEADHRQAASATSDPDRKAYHNAHAEGHHKDYAEASKHLRKLQSHNPKK